MDKVVFHFDWPVPGIKQITRSLSPLIPGGNLWIYTFDMRSVSATTAPQQGATGEVNGKKTAPAVLNAEREEMILLDSAAWQEFEAISSEVEGAFSGVHIAKGNLSAALAGRSVDEVRAAEAALGLAEDRVAKMLNKDFSKKADLQEVITFESYDKGRSAGDGGFADRMGMKRRYIPRAKYEELKQRRIKGVPIKVDLKAAVKVQSSGPGGTSGNASSQAKHDPVNKENFDRDAFVNSLKKITVAGKKEWKTDPWVWDMIDAGGNEFSNAVQHSDSFSTESSAQWLRCVAGAGASAAFNWDRSKGRVGGVLQGSAQAKLVLLEGKYVMSYAIPSIKGWQMNFAGQDLGAIVFVLACELYGFVGAKAALTGSIGVSVSGGKASVKPLERDRNDSLAGAYDQRTGLPRASMDSSDRVVPGALNESVPKETDMNGMGLKAEAFAGAEAGLQPSGDLKWLPPEQRTPVSFAKLSLDVAVSAGAGASGQLFVYYANGKFRVKASARLCWGVGAKGALDFVVDVGNAIELVKWVYYQLAHSGFKVLTYIAKEAFDVLSKILYMLVIEGFGLQDTRLSGIFLETIDAIDNSFEQINLSLSRAEKRELMARNINRKPAWLIYATPETRGMLLYQLTRHDWASHTRSTPSVNILTTDPQIHYMDINKVAIVNIFKCVRTVSEWGNALEHMTVDGRKAGGAGKAEGDILRFLNYGVSLTDDIKGDVFDVLNSGGEIKAVGNKYIEDYSKHRSRLLGQYPKGYEVASIDSMDLQMLAQVDGSVSSLFAVMDDSDSWLGGDQRRIMLAMSGAEHGGEGSVA
ncbi:MAG: DNA repair protein [Stenotrophomonas sp.]